VPLQIKDVKADQWMPNGFGSQPLYTASAKFVPDSEASEESPFEVPYPLEDNALKGSAGNLSVRFGFRKVELVQNKLPGGKSYFFAVNGVPIPVKGSNWIPADAFESRVSRNTPNTTRLAPLFLALKTSHQNMIRNW
jgi:beta-mannosidase